MSKIYGKGDKGKATKLHAEIIRSVGYCERCGTTQAQLQCAHVISRRYSATRTLLNNALCLCASDHFYFTQNPLEFSRFISDTPLREVYDEMFQIANAKYKVDWKERVAELKAIKKRIESGEITLSDARQEEEIA